MGFKATKLIKQGFFPRKARKLNNPLIMNILSD
ncbi:hypothetical protein QE441_000237 [Chryseobacterium sp. SORGH_AS909]|uniref:Transposase n=1 Tax=Chryseobacterium camelliae TaxID=1265445 RepID=A0ABU0TJ47_9FLAO|nr:hypothetical protein [Chryseobacterium camelliae]MDQ1101001.1 hypothetical protein [Chryseobacterium sp. SORGH_AS_1048]MDR6084443.1 hypothetical protein [Chryseobacterium sp. SORGH_AS_0909]MDR6132714.1 hypothetical protein [Chryseobacterium sp. SORGH_AS_1175]MDT3409079.1 hypothetical protein [Pseudacidovorax intermedius]